MSRSLMTTTGLLLAGVLLVIVNLVGETSLGRMRVDLTEQGLFTLSPGSRALAARLDEPVTLRLYVSAEQAALIPPIRSYAARVRGLLEEFVAAANGMLRLQVVDPEPFSEAEDEAVAAGLNGVPVDASGRRLYFGIVASSSTDRREVLPFLDPAREDALEYDISRLIWKLGRSLDKPVLALVTALPLEGQPAMPWAGQAQATPPWFVLGELRELFDVRIVAPETGSLPEDTELLCLAHPRGISESLLFEIDQFVLGGGHALVLVDPWCEVDTAQIDPSDPMSRFMSDQSSSLEPLLAAWGVRVPADELVADRASALRVMAGTGARAQPLDYIMYLGLGPERMGDDFVTADLGLLRAGTVGHIEALPDATTELKPLLSSSDEAMIVAPDAVRFMPDPQRLLSEFKATGRSYVLAARLSGPVATAFPEGRPGSAETGDETGDETVDETVDGSVGEGATSDSARTAAGLLTQSIEPIQVIVVADADLLADSWWVERQSFLGLIMLTANNGDFVRGALDNLSGSNELMGVRRRTAVDRPFERIVAMQRDADRAYATREAELQQELRDTERILSELQSQKDDGSSLVLSPEQEAEIERFRGSMLATRKELREVQHDLRKDIEGLQLRLKFANIALVPLLLCLTALVTSGLRRRAAGVRK